MADEPRAQAIAIVGMAGRFPGARTLDDFWRNVREGVEALEELSDDALDAAGVPATARASAHYVRRATVLEDSDHFDAAFFGLSPREAQILDPQHRVFLECAVEALENAGYAGVSPETPVGVYAGASINTYLLNQLLRDPALLAAVGGYQVMLGNDKDFLCTRVSYKLDLRGPSMTIQTACSTSLVAVQVACRALQRQECDLALAGGVSISYPERAGYLYQEGMIFSPDGHCRPFDTDARGTRGGAGAGIVVLKRLADALADRDTIHAVILGAAINNDGAGKAGYTAPSVDGQVEVIAMAHALAGVEARSIAYVETHGTATPLGDPIEIAALTQVFRASTDDTGFCRIGSLKANLGHLDAAAGVASLIKTVLALQHREIPPLVNFRSPNPQLDLGRSPFAASAMRSSWPSHGAPRRAGVSSFGIGGTNAHAVLEEAPPAAPVTVLREAQLLVLSAKTEAALEAMTARLAAHLENQPAPALADVAWTLQVGRPALPHRRVVVASDAGQASARLREPRKAPVLSAVHEGGARPVAFLFSGQGSQHPGMGAGLYRTERAFREAFDRCATLLEPRLGLDARKVLFGDEAANIDETRLTQPLLFATEYALAAVWAEWGVRPAAMLGHSIGEYVAAHLAGVLSLEDALLVVAERGRLMQELPPGTMASVHLGPSELERWLGREVELAAVNAPSLCTISGPREAVAAVLASLQAAGVESRALHTSHAFHSSMMERALAPFTALLERVPLAPPRIPYVSNLSGTWITADQATSPAYYARHLREAVRFEAGVRTLTANPATLLLEVGPGNALTTLARLGLGKDGAKRVAASLSHPREERAEPEALLEAAGRLWLAGVPLDWKGLHAGERLRRVPLPTYPFERRRYFVEPARTDAAHAEAGPTRTSDRPEDWLYAPTWMREDTPAAVPRLSGAWLVLASPGGLGSGVVDALTRAGASPVLVEPGERWSRLADDHFTVLPGDAEQMTALVAAVEAQRGPVAGAVYLWGAVRDPVEPPTLLAYHAPVALAAGLESSRSGGPVRVILATSGAASVLAEPMLDPGAAMVLGPALVLPAEVPRLQVRAVDVVLGDVPHAAAELVAEAARADGEREVALRAGQRWVRRVERVRLPPADPTSLPLRRGGVYLITGGTGGIGLTLARWLAAEYSARLLLTARTPLPPRAQWGDDQTAPQDRQAAIVAAIREIERSGGEVRIAAADAADPGAMQQAIAEARTAWGPLNGVIHAAGIAGAGHLAFRKSPADVEAVLGPKVGGLAILVRLLGDVPLDFVALMSSVNALVGAPGTADYAAANAVLDAFAESAQRPAGWRHVVSLNWGAWRDVGMAAQLAVPEDRRQAWRAYLDTAITPSAGREAFARVLAAGRRRVAVVPQDLAVGHRAMRSVDTARTEAARAAPPVSDVPPPSALERPDVSTSYVAPQGDVESRLAGIWSDLLGVDRVGTDDDFFELGGHSLLATRVLARIDEALGVRLSLRDIFDAPTIHRLAEKVAASGTAAAPAADREELEF